uniref:Ras-associating domain-containing protein n=1 Tax=Echeneis naucrates TaxID=173247 RepID=A0A665V182_ECHNA
MELKVWVEGVVRVVCGVSLDTSCQDVVIALAQAIGQTGRYILILKLRGNETHLVAEDCPLQHLAQLGQLALEVQFILRRTGPSLSEGQNTSDLELAVHRHSMAVTQQHKEALEPLRHELDKRLQQGEELGATVSETQRRLQTAKEILQVTLRLLIFLHPTHRYADYCQVTGFTGVLLMPCTQTAVYKVQYTTYSLPFNSTT